MGVGKIARGLGKVGLAIEALSYIVTGVKSLSRATKRKNAKADLSVGAGSDQQNGPGGGHQDA